jgi:hypothetical protein
MHRTSKGDPQGRNPHSHRLRGKEFFERLGHGLSSQQYLNILFNLIGAPLYLIAVLNGAKVFLGSAVSYMLYARTTRRVITHLTVPTSALVFGFSFILVALAVYIRSILLFMVAVLVGSITLIPYGDIYHQLFRNLTDAAGRALRHPHFTAFGTLVTSIGLVGGAYLLDTLPLAGRRMPVPLTSNLFQLRLSGYWLVLELTALCFVASGLLAYAIIKAADRPAHSAPTSVRMVLRQVKQNRTLALLLVASSLTSLMTTLGHAFYGVFIYTELGAVGFRGFMNIAVIFVIAVFTALLAPGITHRNIREYGRFSMLLFGVILMAIMPLSYFYKPNLISIAAGTILGVFGSSVLATAHSLVINHTLPMDARKGLAQSAALAALPCYAIGIPLGGIIVYLFGLPVLFLCLSLGMLLMLPIYGLVATHHKEPW